MKPDQAEQNLQVIRTLMERSTLYRRALGPIMVLAGSVGVIAAVIGFGFSIGGPRAFFLYWLAIAVVVVSGVFFLARRQALRDREPFWSPPTRRVTLALVPPLGAGLIFTAMFPGQDPLRLVIYWMLFYAAGLHAAGFLAPVGLRYLGWAIAVFSMGAWVCLNWLYWPMEARPVLTSTDAAHLLMGVSFGAFHLLYGLRILLNTQETNAS